MIPIIKTRGKDFNGLASLGGQFPTWHVIGLEAEKLGGSEGTGAFKTLSVDSTIDVNLMKYVCSILRRRVSKDGWSQPPAW